MGQLTPEIHYLLEHYRKFERQRYFLENSQKMRIEESLGIVAVLYERVRNVVDYKGEHLLRKNAIERILRRLLWERDLEPGIVAGAIIKELTWARYLKNNSLPLGIEERIVKVLKKYLRLQGILDSEIVPGIAAAEVEEILVPSLHHIEAYTNVMFSWFKREFSWKDALDDRIKDIDLFVAIQKSLHKSDLGRIYYSGILNAFENWRTYSEDDVLKVAQEVRKIISLTQDEVNSPIQARLYRFVQKQTAHLQILKEIFEEDGWGEEVFEDRENLEKLVRHLCRMRYKEIGANVRRGIVRSIIYIFVTKVLIVLLIEIPFEVFLLGSIQRLTVVINLLTPPLMMFVIGLLIRRPDERNTDRIVAKVNNFVYAENSKRIEFSVHPDINMGILFKVFTFLYAVFFLAVFLGISYLLYLLKFNVVSSGVFFIFLSLVLLFGFRVKYSASEFDVSEVKEGLLSRILTNLSLPFLNLGVWLSNVLSKINFLVVVMDFLIEAPLKGLIEVAGEWSRFIREKKEEVIQVPEV